MSIPSQPAATPPSTSGSTSRATSRLVGITAFAADAIGDVVYVELPAVGDTVTGGDSCGEIESTKSVSELFAPVDGEVLEINESVVNDPGLLNTDPFERGLAVPAQGDRDPRPAGRDGVRITDRRRMR